MTNGLFAYIISIIRQHAHERYLGGTPNKERNIKMERDSFTTGIGYCIALCQRNGEEAAASLILQESGLTLDDFADVVEPEDFEAISEVS